MVVVIQSQRNSYHAHRGEQRKVEILQQAAELGKVKVFISYSTGWEISVKPVLKHKGLGQTGGY